MRYKRTKEGYMLDLESIKDGCRKATSGPWVAAINPFTNRGFVNTMAGKIFSICNKKDHQFDGDDARFIAHARQDIPVMVVEIERLNKELNETHKLRKKLCSEIDIIGKEMTKLMRENERMRQERNEKSIQKP